MYRSRDEEAQEERRAADRGRQPEPPAAWERPGSLTPADVLRMQGAAGNRTTARMLAGAPARERRLQRLIAVNPAGNPATDYAIMKQVHQLRASQNPPHAIVMLTAGVDFRAMAPGEDLFIVSHGNAETGQLQNITVQSLLTYLNDKNKGLPDNFGKITVLSCYGGMAKSNEALADSIAKGIKPKGHVVEGALGFSFGTAEFSSTGRSSVLSEDLRVFYSAADFNGMVEKWSEMMPTHGGGVLAQFMNYVNQYSTIKDNLQGALGAKTAEGRIKTLVQQFQTSAKGIEQGLSLALNQAPGATVQEKINALEAPPPAVGGPPAYQTNWNALLAQQYQLFNDYYLWTDPEAAFATFTS